MYLSDEITLNGFKMISSDSKKINVFWIWFLYTSYYVADKNEKCAEMTENLQMQIEVFWAIVEAWFISTFFDIHVVDLIESDVFWKDEEAHKPISHVGQRCIAKDKFFLFIFPRHLKTSTIACSSCYVS